MEESSDMNGYGIGRGEGKGAWQPAGKCIWGIRRGYRPDP